MENEKAEITRLVEKYDKVQSLMKYVNKVTLAEMYRKQPKGKAIGVDGITKEMYGENLEINLEELLEKMKKFAYKPYPVRRAYIPKENGKFRGLGIPSFEDKLVQGGLISPVMANVYLHYTLDLWFDYIKAHEFKGEMYMVRYADDFVCMFQYENEAHKFYKLLIERLKKFGLEIAEDKSKIMPYGRFRGTKESFDFLGFTHYNAKSHWGKYCVLHRTSKKKLKQKKKVAKEWLRKHMHESIPETIRKLNIKLKGHYRYYGIYGNAVGMMKFYKYIQEQLWKIKRRRDQSCWLTWKKFYAILKVHPLEYPKIYIKSAY